MPTYHLSAAELDTRDPEFHARWREWADEFKRDAAEIVAATQDTIATSQNLLAKMDRLLAR
jgi:hypothetical protein